VPAAKKRSRPRRVIRARATSFRIRQKGEVVGSCQLVKRLGRAGRRPPVRGRRALEARDVELREHGAPTSEPGVDRGALEAFAEQEVAEALHRCLARPVIGAREALLGQLVAQTSRTLSTSAST